MILHLQLNTSELKTKIRHREINFAGNRQLKIYGTLSCTSGKKMKMENRIFFKNEQEAQQLGYRPCGHCMKEAYKKWIYSTIR